MSIGSILLLVITSTLRMAVCYILASLGGTFSVRSGVTDLGCEGMMIWGAFFGVFGCYYTQNIWLGALFGMLFGAIISMLHAVLHVTFRVNGTISGMCVNLLGAASAPLFIQVLWKVKGNSPMVNKFTNINLGPFENIPILGQILSAQNILFYIAILIIVLSNLLMFRTPFGLRLRMVGEHPSAASAVGLNVTAYKYFGVAMCGAMCGLGGVYLSMGQLNLYSDGMTAGRGYIAIVINAFGHYTPLGALSGSLFFGFFESLQVVFQGMSIPSQIVMMLPYIMTLIVVCFGLRHSRMPMGVGKYHN